MDKVKIIKFDPEKCTGCLECEKACSQVQFRSDEGGEKSAIRILKEDDGYVMTNCNQNGLCIDVCPVQALKRMPNGVVVVKKDLCIGCMTCVAFCPMGAMRRAPGMVFPHKCISCGACVRACPENALSLEEVNISDIEQKVYISQGVCP